MTEHRFPRDEVDPAAHRRILLALADDLGVRLRAAGQIATGVTCMIRYADLTATRRSRTLPVPPCPVEPPVTAVRSARKPVHVWQVRESSCLGRKMTMTSDKLIR
ncbi:hypothetical protein [Streptomyces sp. NPDC097610]|uniref:DinB/UmuC family translesion DNA polymerase n=1 Tax=Streptomyces sp. NPDC097610 TaxID=3157227 RepID=UPI0033236AF0